MSALILFSLSISGALLLPMMAQPLSLGLVIMILTLLMCSLSAMLLSSCYGYILFLIYVGGLLVMLAYVAALSPNSLFSSGYSLLFCNFSFISFLFYFSYFVDYNFWSYYDNYTKKMFTKTYGGELGTPSMISILIALGLIL